MNGKKQISRADLMRSLHALAGEVYMTKEPHLLLHQFAVAEFGVESMAHLSGKELQMLYFKVKEHAIDDKELAALGIASIPEMSIKQKGLVRSLQRELGWSEEYLIEIAIKRYGYLHWKYLTGREAWAYCNYLISRRRNKLINERQKNGKKVPGKQVQSEAVKNA